MFDYKTMAILGIASTAVVMSGCAENVGDIDRTQPNALSKADFKGVWYIRQTAVDVPGTERRIFVGVASNMEKIRWEVQEGMLIAFRAYEMIPGYDQDAGKKVNGETKYKDGVKEGRDENYKEAPIAAFRIISHFDIQRSYNSATGEQSNVIVENRTDRPWFERSYMRVDWSRNLISTGFAGFERFSDANYFVQDNEGTPEAFYTEHRKVGDKKQLAYFDFVNRVTNGINMVKLRYSFFRLENYERDYEPAYYDDDMMTKFGYFRTIRYVYDRKFGFLDKKVLRLANRHDMWKNDFKRDAKGEFLRDAENRRIPTPMAEREPKPIVYHLSPNFPKELEPGAFAVARDWDRAFSRSVAAVKGISADEVKSKYGSMFLLCKDRYDEYPDGEEEACDVRPTAAKWDANGKYIPFEARPGDLRLSFIYWVHQPQAAGPLGYGPSFADPETGEIVSGTAYVYGASVDTYAQSALQQIRYANGDFTEDQIRNGDDINNLILNRFDQATADPRARGTGPSPKLKGLSVEDAQDKLIDDKGKALFRLFEKNGFESLKGDPNLDQRVFDRLKKEGYDQLMLDDETISALAQGVDKAGFQFDPTNPSQQALDDILKYNNPLDLHKKYEAKKEHWEWAARNNIYLAEFADNAIIGTSKKYKDRKDYDAIWNELRNEIFRAVMAHEVGHTIGLRHNFQGSYDTVNYFDDYWKLKKQNFKRPQGVFEMYNVNKMTSEQVDGDMTRFQYSTIMDYHSRFNSDWSGIGKYDEAAIMFAYTFGTYEDIKEDNTESIPVEPGYVEVMTDVKQEVREFLHAYDNRFAPSQHPLEDLHYTTLIDAMGGPDVLNKRELMRYSKVLQLREQHAAGSMDRPVEVPYMFCSDEWAGSLISCNRWDLGSDPLEIVQWSVRSYYEYYPFRNFRRGRVNFNSFSAVLSALRNFSTMPFVYQQWFFNRYYSNDQVMSTYYQLAAFAGLNFLKDVATMPSYGAYRTNDDGEMQLVSYDPEYQSDDGVDLRVYPGEGRRQYTSFDTTRGYYYWQYPREAGHFWESTWALNMLASTSLANVLGQDVDADKLSYRLPYTLYFDDQLQDLFNGFFTRDYGMIAPRVANGRLLNIPLAPLSVENNGSRITFDPLTGEELETNMINNSTPVRFGVNFNQRLYGGIINGLRAFRANFQRSYLDQARVFKLGSGQQVTPGPNHEVIKFTDPSSGVTYAALHLTTDTRYAQLGAKLVKQGSDLSTSINDNITTYNDLVSQINGGQLTPTQREAAIRQANGLVDEINQDSFELQNTIQDINILSGAVDIFDNPL